MTMGLFDGWRERHLQRQYEKFYNKVERMPEDQKRDISKAVYGDLWDSIKSHYSTAEGMDELGGTSVAFACPYPGHVSFHAKRNLDAEVSSPESPIHSYSIEGDEHAGWILTVVSRGADGESARLIADACAMATILNIPTSQGEYDRVQFSVTPKDAESADDAAAKLMEIIPGILRGEHILVPNESDPTKCNVIDVRGTE